MLYGLTGEIVSRHHSFVVLRAGGIAFKVVTNERTQSRLPSDGTTTFFCHLRMVEGGSPELYGFVSEEDLLFFEQLLTVSGVGPKSALSILDVSDLPQLLATIKEDRPDLLARASGIGKKTAARIILELKGKIKSDASRGSVKGMERDIDLVEALMVLGYGREQAERALQEVHSETQGIEARLREALSYLKAH